MISKEELEQMYWGNEMSMTEIGDAIGVSRSTVSGWMRKYDIESRMVSDAKLIGTHMISKERLESMYLGEEMSQSQIAKSVGVYQSTVGRWMTEHNIKPRTNSESLLVGTRMLSKEELENMYWDQKMSMSEIAENIGADVMSVCKWMQKHNIKARTNSESVINGDFTGERSSNWQGGISFEPYCYKFNNKFKEAVRKRDDYICQLCGYEQLLCGRKLDVHHIHYDKENCYPDVVALCRSCNIIVNSNRDHWEQYFGNQLLERGLIEWRYE